MRMSTCCLTVSALLVQPVAVDAQLAVPFDAERIRAAALANRCGVETQSHHAFLTRISALLGGSDRPMTRALDELEAEAREGAAAAPDNADAQYGLAAVLGVRTDLAEGRVRLESAERLLDQVQRVLEIEPSHPGAHHIVGRLNAGVMRMSRLDRFLARTLLGGDVLDQASWSVAREHLETAESHDPCVPDHHYELARLYLDRDEPGLAYREIGHVMGLTALDANRWANVRDKVIRLADGM